VRTVCLLLFIRLLLLVPCVGFSETYPDAVTERRLRDVLEKVLPAYVFVKGGSGAVISPEGLVITNNHVVRKAKKMDIRLGDGRSFKAVLLGRDPQGDLALLKIEGAGQPLPWIRLADSDAVRVGEFCIAVGNPFGMGFVDQEPTVTFGVISAVHQYSGNYSDAIVTDAPINPGNSGGPLLNMKGELIGVNGMIRTRWGLRSNTGVGFAIPANQVKRWLPFLEKAGGGIVRHGRLIGLAFEELKDGGAERAVVKEVKKGSDAEKAGFLPGDEILSCDGKPVWSPIRFRGILGTYPAGMEITVTVKRRGRTEKLVFKLPELRPGRFGFSLARPRGGDSHPRVGTVRKGSAAEKAGLKAGDEITEVQNRPLAGPVAAQVLRLTLWMRGVPPGTEVSFTVKRKEEGKEKTLTVTYTVE